MGTRSSLARLLRKAQVWFSFLSIVWAIVALWSAGESASKIIKSPWWLTAASVMHSVYFYNLSEEYSDEARSQERTQK